MMFLSAGSSPVSRILLGASLLAVAACCAAETTSTTPAETDGAESAYILRVGTGRAQYTCISEAVAAIPQSGPNKPSASQPWLIKVGPGTYRERFKLPDYVSLEGAAIGQTIITGGHVATISEPDKFTIALGEGSAVSKLTAVNPSAKAFGEASIVIGCANKGGVAVRDCHISNQSPTTWGRDAVYLSLHKGGAALLEDCIVESSSDVVSVECSEGGASFYAQHNRIICCHQGNSIMFWMAGARTGAANKFCLVRNNGSVPSTGHSPALCLHGLSANTETTAAVSNIYLSENSQTDAKYQDGVLLHQASVNANVFHFNNSWGNLGGGKNVKFTAYASVEGCFNRLSFGDRAAGSATNLISFSKVSGRFEFSKPVSAPKFIGDGSGLTTLSDKALPDSVARLDKSNNFGAVLQRFNDGMAISPEGGILLRCSVLAAGKTPLQKGMWVRYAAVTAVNGLLPVVTSAASGQHGPVAGVAYADAGGGQWWVCIEGKTGALVEPGAKPGQLIAVGSNDTASAQGASEPSNGTCGVVLVDTSGPPNLRLCLVRINP